jgi:putative nucleotidyltransferase with HDIG domain
MEGKLMEKIKFNEVKPGMILAVPIYLGGGDVELLSADVEITNRHIQLMERLGIESITVKEEKGPEKKPLSNAESVDLIKKEAALQNKKFDAEDYLNALNEIEISPEDLEPVLVNVANANMVISVLTGEGNVPIDEKHKDLVEHTQKAFQTLKTSIDLDLDTIRDDINKAIPDMIRNNDVLMRLSQLKASDNLTFDHSLRVSILATMIGKWMGYPKERLSELAQAALLFDIGKMKIPDFVLNKPEKTKDEEFDIIKKHAQFGYSILLKTQGVTNNIKYSALQHHERMDGTGYPLRLREGQIHEFAKIIMVCDIFDAMTHEKPYRKKISPFVAAEFIQWQSGKTLDAKICYIFLSNLAAYFTGKEVELSTGEKGKIIYVDVNFPTRPVVQVEEHFYDLVKEKEIKILDIL